MIRQLVITLLTDENLNCHAPARTVRPLVDDDQLWWNFNSGTTTIRSQCFLVFGGHFRGDIEADAAARDPRAARRLILPPNAAKTLGARRAGTRAAGANWWSWVRVSQSAVQRFYRYHAMVYDKTRWMILHGRRRAVEKMGLRPDSEVLEVGCGTGLNFRDALEPLDCGRGRWVWMDY